jgi:hypothetical membrane protein
VQYSTSNKFTVFALWMGVFVPILYFGLQLVAAPFYPNYSLLSNTASELGASSFVYGGIVSMAIIAVGVLTLIAAAGYGVALWRARTPILLIGLACLTLAANGVQTILAGVYPMPDPRHAGIPILTLGMIAFPLVLALVAWRLKSMRPALPFIAIGIVCVLALMPIMSGAVQIDTRPYIGLIQRVLALAIFAPIGIGAFLLLRTASPMAGAAK